jgi:hypothetical protein
MDLSDPKTWTDGLAVVVGAPHIVVPLVIAVGGAVWWVRGKFEERKRDGLQASINVLQERLHNAREQQSYLSRRLTDAQAEIAKLKQQIEDRAAPEVLRGTISSAAKFIDDTATANDDLRKAIAGTIARVKVPR